MNLIGWIVLAALLVDYALGVVATVLNLRALDPELPPSFSDTYDEEEYRRSQRYTRAKARLGLFSETVGLIVLLAFWFLGGFEILDRFVRSFGFGEVLTGVLFIFALGLGMGLIGLPVSIYRTFVLENRFGFNRTTVETFIADRLKGLALGVVIGGPVLAMIIAFFVHFGSPAWLYAWIALVAVTLVMQYVGPRLIMPLFNKFDPLEDGDLRERILDYAERVRFPLKNVFVMDASKRSSKSNAFFTGFGRNRRVVLFDTLVDDHESDEIVAIVAHEVGHYRKHHVLQNILVSVVHSGVMLFLLSLVLSSPQLYEAFFVTEPSVYTGLVFFGLLYSPIELLLSIGMNALSRHNEYVADAFAAETAGASSDLAKALKKLSTSNLSNLTPHPFYVWLHYSHPPVLERVRTLTG